MTKRMFLGRRSVTRVMPGMGLRPSLVRALRAFFSLREWIVMPEEEVLMGRPERKRKKGSRVSRE